MGRKFRFIQLTAEERKVLEQGHRHGKSHVFRQRCHLLLLSAQGKTIKELCELFGLRPNTVIGWFNRWEAQGIEGLRTRAGQGRKPKIALDNAPLVEAIKEKVGATPKQLDRVLSELKQQADLSLSRATLKRFLKKTVGAGSDSGVI